jgi:hypothetical protein
MMTDQSTSVVSNSIMMMMMMIMMMMMDDAEAAVVPPVASPITLPPVGAAGRVGEGGAGRGRTVWMMRAAVAMVVVRVSESA